MREFSSRELLEKYIEPSQLDLYLREVETANKKFSLFSRNLVRRDLEELVADCLVVRELLWLDSSCGKILDIGSGWGLPSIPFLLSEPTLDITLAERSQKKADFLALLLHKLRIRGTVHDRDLKALDKTNTFDLIISRRVAFDDKLIKVVKNLSHDRTEMIYFGTAYPGEVFGSAQVIDYSLDRSPVRTIIKSIIF